MHLPIVRVDECGCKIHRLGRTIRRTKKATVQPSGEHDPACIICLPTRCGVVPERGSAATGDVGGEHHTLWWRTWRSKGARHQKCNVSRWSTYGARRLVFSTKVSDSHKTHHHENNVSCWPAYDGSVNRTPSKSQLKKIRPKYNLCPA